MSRPLMYPELLTFDDLFDSSEPCTKSDLSFAAEAPLTDEGKREGFDHGLRIGTYCALQIGDGYDSLKVQAKPEVCQAILDNSLHLDGDTMYFEIIQGSRVGKALVTCSHNQIIGGRWVAEITLDSIPKGK